MMMMLIIAATHRAFQKLATWQLCGIARWGVGGGGAGAERRMRFRSMTHDSPGSHLFQYVPNWHYTFFGVNREGQRERETEPAQRMGSMAGQRDFQSPRQHPIQRGFSSWHLTDDNDDDVKGVEGDRGLKDTPSRCASSSSASLQVSSGELEATELSVSMYGIESAKNQFQSFWGNFFIAIFGVLPDPPWVFEPGEGIAQVMWTNKAIEWFWGYKFEYPPTHLLLLMACLCNKNIELIPSRTSRRVSTRQQHASRW